MKNAEVIKRFIDKYTKDIHEIGEIIELDDERYKEGKERGLVKYSRKKPKKD